MTFNEYLIAANQRASVAYEQERTGQSFYNVLSVNRPDVARLVIGTSMDPYYDDNSLDAFFTFVELNW